ncbi:MAG: hypothetical protein HQ534_01925 [Armatimonadetes bacterium]|nr:hypothetical protein [Armatimonadota bacterium]
MIVLPRGIKIYLPRDYSFALMARLYPKVDAFKVLEKAQGIYRIHSAVGFITGLVYFLLQLPPLQIAVWTFCVTFAFYLLRLFGIFFIPGQVVIPTIYSRFTGFGLITIIIFAVGLWRVGIIGTIAYIVARLVVEGLTMLIDRKAGANFGVNMGMEPAFAQAGAMYLAPAKDFINAYKLYAVRFGVPVDVEVSDEELRKENWIHVWDDLVRKWPQVALRFPKDDDGELGK